MLAIENLSDAEAVAAVRLLYASSEGRHWENGNRPGLERLRSLVSGCIENITHEDREAIDRLTLDSSPEGIALRAGVARLILQGAERSSPLALPLSTALDGATKPNMGIDPVSGTILIGMLLALSRFERSKDGSWKIEFGAGAQGLLKELRLAELVKALPAVLRAIPEALKIMKLSPDQADDLGSNEPQ